MSDVDVYLQFDIVFSFCGYVPKAILSPGFKSDCSTSDNFVTVQMTLNQNIATVGNKLNVMQMIH